jgi:hypothetical protein
MKTKEQLQAEVRKLQLQLNKIVEAEDAARDAAYLGRCFKARNNYSCPSKPSDYWWVYIKVTSIKDGIQGLMFQIDCNGRIDIKPNEFFMAQTLDNDTPITDAQFDKAWLKCLDAAKALGC